MKKLIIAIRLSWPPLLRLPRPGSQLLGGRGLGGTLGGAVNGTLGGAGSLGGTLGSVGSATQSVTGSVTGSGTAAPANRSIHNPARQTQTPA